MRNYENKRKLKSKQGILTDKNIKMPEKNIPVVISDKLIVYTDDVSKIEMIKQKYANK